VILIGLSLLIALFVPALSFVFSITGTVSSSLTSFILPPLLLVKIRKIRFKSRQILPYAAVVVFGVAVMVLGLVTFIVKLV
jgi:hypothetical protein